MVRDEGWLGYRRKCLDLYGTLRHDASTSHDSSIGGRLAAAHRGGLYSEAEIARARVASGSGARVRDRRVVTLGFIHLGSNSLCHK